MEEQVEALQLAPARAEFIHLSEADVWQALEKNNDNPIAVEVARIAIDFLAAFKAHVDQNGLVPHPNLQVRPRYPIEKVAMKVMVAYAEFTTAEQSPPGTLH
jgi:hypothetical protein